VGVIVVELPTGTVTLVFTDIEGSTRLLRSLGDDYGRLLRAHGRSCGRRWPATAGSSERYLAEALAALGERPRAYALVSETLSLLRAWDERTELADTLEILATMAAQEGETERVVRLLAGRPPSAAPPGHPSATTSAPSWPGGWSRPVPPSAAPCSPRPPTSPGAGP